MFLQRSRINLQPLFISSEYLHFKLSMPSSPSSKLSCSTSTKWVSRRNKAERRDAGAQYATREGTGRVVLVLLGRTPDLSVRQLKGPPVDLLGGGGNWSGKRFTDAAQLIKKSVLASTWHLSHTPTTSIYKAAPGPNCVLRIGPIISRASTHSCRLILQARTSRPAFDGRYITFLKGREMTHAYGCCVMQQMGRL